MEQKDMVFDIAKDPYNYVMRVVFCRWKPFILQAMDTDFSWRRAANDYMDIYHELHPEIIRYNKRRD